MSEQTFSLLLYTMLALAVVVFISLYFVKIYSHIVA